MKQEASTPLPTRQGLFCVFKSVRLLSFLICFIAIGICFLGIGAFNQTLAANYYVDSSITDTNPANATPDCTNYNTSTFACSGGSASAYTTIADINAGSFSGDDQILFRKGQTWREQLTAPSSGTSGHPITFGAFGSGANPIISGADIITGWTNYSGNVWQATLTTQPNQVFFDGTRGTLETAIVNIDVQYEWYWAANVLYVYSTSDPDSAWTDPGVEASTIANNINENGKSFVTFQYLTLQKANYTGFRMGTAASNIIVEYCTITGAYNSGIATAGNAAMTYVTVRNNTLNWNGASGVAFDPNCTNWTIEDNVVHNNSQVDLNEDDHIYTGGIKGWAGDNSVKAIIIQRNTVYSNGKLPNSARTVYASGKGIWLDTLKSANYVDGALITRNNVYDNQGDGILLESTSYTTVTYNLVYDTVSWEGSGEGIRFSDRYLDNPASYNRIYNNVVYGNSIAGIMAQGSNGLEANRCDGNEVKNNIVVGNGTAGSYELYAEHGCENDGTMGSGNVYTYNAFGPQATNFILWGTGVTPDTYAAWYALYAAANGNTIEGDPLFVGGGEAKPYPYFYPRSYSPAINAGTDVGLTKDYLNVNVPQGAAPDIGAFEYTVSIPENIWFFFPLFLALPRLIFLLSSRQGRSLLLSLIGKREYKGLLREIYLPYLNLASYLLKRIA